MRLLSAIIVSGLVLAPNAAWSVPTDAATQHSHDRNPIEWLFSDIGDLFATAIEKLDHKAKPLTDISKDVTEVAEPVIATSPFAAHPVVDLDKDLFGEDNFDLDLHQGTASATLETPNQPKPTLRDLFQNIIAALSQPHQSDQTEPVAKSEYVAATAALDVVEAQPTSEIAANDDAVPTAPTNDLFKTFEAAAIAFEEDDAQAAASEPRPSLGEFFASIVGAFSAEEESAQQGITQNIAAAREEAPVKVEEAAPVITADKASEPKLDTPIVLGETAENYQFEPAPWQVFPHVAVFTPNTDIFDSSKAPVEPAQTPIQSPVAMTVETAQLPEETEPAIRKRVQKNPLARNHLSLGQSNTDRVPEEETGFLNHLVETFVGEDAKSTDQSEVLASRIPDHLIPEEKLDLGYIAPDSTTANAPADELTTIGEGVLKNIDLYLGANTVIGHPYQPNAHASGTCIERSLQVSVFCVTDIDWPSEISQSFAQDTAFTLPGEGVIRYENGRISRVYTPFKAQDFAEVVKFMQRRFGPPLEREIVWMHMIEAPKMPNTTFRWRAVSADRKNSVVLEVRNFDDLRRSFADLNRGMVRLYRDGSRPIFKHLSTMDLMLIQRRRITQAPVVPDAKTTAN